MIVKLIQDNNPDANLSIGTNDGNVDKFLKVVDKEGNVIGKVTDMKNLLLSIGGLAITIELFAKSTAMELFAKELIKAVKREDGNDNQNNTR